MTKLIETKASIIAEPFDALTIEPTAAILQCLWQIPMIQSDL
jgi:hypothetical protein